MRTNEQAHQPKAAGEDRAAQASRRRVSDLGSCGVTRPGSSPGVRTGGQRKRSGADSLSESLDFVKHRPQPIRQGLADDPTEKFKRMIMTGKDKDMDVPPIAFLRPFL